VPVIVSNHIHTYIQKGKYKIHVLIYSVSYILSHITFSFLIPSRHKFLMSIKIYTTLIFFRTSFARIYNFFLLNCMQVNSYIWAFLHYRILIWHAISVRVSLIASVNLLCQYNVKDTRPLIHMSVELPLFPAIMFGEQYAFSDYVIHIAGPSRL
jgi:hypothetical protein